MAAISTILKMSPALLLAAGLAACKESAAVETSGAADVAAVERRTLEIRAEASGLIEPIRVVEVKSKASGEILKLHVETGNRVERSTLLAEVDPRDVRNALAQAEADLEVARARLSTAEAQRSRSEELRQANVITEQELENTQLEVANARSQLVKAETNLQLARERMNDVTIRAPLSGTIIQKNVEVGQIIQSASQNISGGTTLFLMADLAEMQVRTLVDETDIGRIEPGQTARVSVEAFPNRTFTGQVLKIEPQAVVEQNVTMFPVLVRLENPEGLLKPGMNAEVQIEIARRDDVVAVPNAAVVAMRDAGAAGAVLGLDEEQLRTALRAARGAAGGGRGRGARPGPADAAETGQAPANSAAEKPGAGEQSATAPDAVAGDVTAEKCQNLRERARSGGREALSEEDRATARACFARARSAAGAGGGMPVGGTDGVHPGTPGAPGAASWAGGGSGTGDVRPGVIFVQGAGGPEPRTVLLGLNDWDFTEVIRGVEPGEQVILMSVARLQQAQQAMLDRIRERAGGPLPGARAGGRR